MSTGEPRDSKTVENDKDMARARKLERRIRIFQFAPWTLAVLLGLFWLFDVGDGPLDASRIGVVPQWISAIAATAAVIRYWWQSMEDERKSLIRRVSGRIGGHIQREIDAERESRHEVPVVISVIHDDTLTVTATLGNFSSVPLSKVKAFVDTGADWTGIDVENSKAGNSPESKKIYRHQLGTVEIVGPGERHKFSGEKLKIPEERWRDGGRVQLDWEVAEMKYSHTHFVGSDKEYRSVQDRKRV